MNVHQDISSAPANVDQVDATLSIEMTNTTGTYMKDLNEYCLLEIFSCRLLTPMDLCSLAETCKLFKQMTQRAFPKDFGILSPDAFNCRYTIEWKNHEIFDQTVDEQHVERILKHFGRNLCKLSIRHQVVVNLIAKYCNDVKLKRLEIYSMQSIHWECMKLRSVYRGLLALSVDGCDRFVTSTYINCDSLVELTITGCVAVLKNTFPKLERFTFRDHDGWYANNDDNTDSIAQFIRRHTHLRVLDLVGSSIYFSSDLVDAIGNNDGELVELTLRCLKRPMISIDVFNAISLPKLRKLDIFADIDNSNQIGALLQSSALEKVTLLFLYDVEVRVFDVLSKLENLRELMLVCNHYQPIPWSKVAQLRKLSLSSLANAYFPANLPDIIGQLTNLEELEFDDYCGRETFVLTKKDFLQIVKIVERRPSVLTLKCRYKFNLPKICDKNQRVRLMQ